MAARFAPIPHDDEPPFRVVVVGAEGVGKTALVRRVVCDAFRDEHWPTAGVDVVTAPASLSSRRCVQLWDTPGKPEAAALVGSALRAADVAVVVYDHRDATLRTALRWVEAAHQSGGPPVFLVRNKSECADTRKRSIFETGQNAADRIFTVSAKQGTVQEFCGALRSAVDGVHEEVECMETDRSCVEEQSPCVLCCVSHFLF